MNQNDILVMEGSSSGMIWKDTAENRGILTADPA
jgi:hypothetical protein